MGATVYTTCRGSDREFVQQLGAHHAIDFTSKDYTQEIASLTGGKGVNVVLDTIGGLTLSQSPHVLSDAGRYVAAFVPDVGETALALAGKFPGGTLGEALDQPVMLSDGGKDLYIQQAKFHQQFAADVSKAAATLMAATQRPIAEAALTQASGAPAWKDVPSWSIYGTADKNIPPPAMRFMSDRAGAKKVVEVKEASHVVMVSHPDKVAALIVEAAR
jgi:pimeloyl-ACP methyl ester carboxylesterase